MTPLLRFSARCRRLFAAIAVLAFQLLLPAALWAASSTPQGPKVHDDTMPYLLVVLCLALGFILLCRSASRSKEVRLQELDDD